ncbi:protein of unknown function [Chitinimonas taiwanensis DSM 18899]|uniref:PoNi C-terminal domain-containing protein n=2 Tax=Chitinimonas TaxID=240411 RepID=A0A1K2HKZ5_9NEIS|nr:protein of unknown function [Chitinimonas taiwanensis DSM 18899]
MEVANIDSKKSAIQEGHIPSSDTAYTAVRGGAFKSALKLVRLHYTAGQNIESLHSLYSEAMNWFEAWHKSEHEFAIALAQETGQDLQLDATPCEFEDLYHFQLALDVVSIGILLGEADKVRSAAKLMSSSRHTDMLFESLIERYVPDTSQTEEFFHEVPYGPLVDVIYTAQTAVEASAYMLEYLNGWYSAFKETPWYNGHLEQTDEYSNYEGYWAFEAAAVCVLYGIDDTSFRDHLVYPKDLADWARANHVLDRVNAVNPSDIRLRCEAGQPCPQAGYWFTPAKADSRRAFKQGDIMPAVDSAYGATIWQWDADQQK